MQFPQQRERVVKGRVSTSFYYSFSAPQRAFLRCRTSGGLLSLGGTFYFVEQTLPWCPWPCCPINDISFNLTLCLSCLPGSPTELSCLAGFSPQWQLTQSRHHCKFQGHSLFVILTPHPPHIHHGDRFRLKQPRGIACWLKSSKTSPEKIYTPAPKGTQIFRDNWHWL